MKSESVAICAVTPGESIVYGSGKVVCGLPGCVGFTDMACKDPDCKSGNRVGAADSRSQAVLKDIGGIKLPVFISTG